MEVNLRSDDSCRGKFTNIRQWFGHSELTIVKILLKWDDALRSFTRHNAIQRKVVSKIHIQRVSLSSIHCSERDASKPQSRSPNDL